MSRNLERLLEKHKGLKLKVYRCPAGKWTIGIGRNLEDSGISREEAFYLLRNDLKHRQRLLEERVHFWGCLSSARKAVLIDMAINLGVRGLLGFRRMLVAMERDDYQVAATEMLDSLWAKQVQPDRVNRLTTMMRTGRWPQEFL